MLPNLLAAANLSVKHHGAERVSHMGMSTEDNAIQGIRDRMRQILDETSLSMREWSRRAGQSEAYVEAILRGGSSSPEVGRLRRLAACAGYSPAWLISGAGDKHEVEGVEDRYPSLRKLLDDPTKRAKWSEAAIAAVKSTKLKSDVDPGEAFWAQILDTTDTSLRVGLQPLLDALEGIDDFPSDKKIR